MSPGECIASVTVGSWLTSVSRCLPEDLFKANPWASWLKKGKPSAIYKCGPPAQPVAWFSMFVLCEAFIEKFCAGQEKRASSEDKQAIQIAWTEVA